LVELCLLLGYSVELFDLLLVPETLETLELLILDVNYMLSVCLGVNLQACKFGICLLLSINLSWCFWNGWASP